MELDVIKDQKGNDLIIFNTQDYKDNEFMGDKLSDFEFLQSLGEGGQGNVYKVLSLINHKIYAMKIIDQDKGIEEKYLNREIEILSQLNHPNIVKYYKNFKEKNKLYIIMEYFENGDLKNYIEVLSFSKIKNQIKLDEIWNIFYQCMSALTYIHSFGIIHRDIKPQNIFMSKNKIIKIGDFGISGLIKKQISGTNIGSDLYKAPEINFKKYDEKVDIYSMGCVFYEIYFLEEYRKEVWEKKEDTYVKIFKNQEKPKKLDDFMKIIFRMLEEDFKKRPDSKTIFEEIKQHYNKIFIQNSGIYSVLRCMINLPNLNKFFIEKQKNKNIEKDINENKAYSNIISFCIENEKNWIDILTFIRHKIIEENNFLNNNKEINPYLIFTFILEKINGELNNSIFASFKSNIFNPYNKEEVKENYMKYFKSYFNSFISDNFVTHMETKRKCSECKMISYLFTYSFSLEFELELLLKKNNNIQNINLNELFSFQNNMILNIKKLKEVKCNKCNSYKNYFENKVFYELPKELVLSFDRGYNCENKIKINYPEKLDLSNIPKIKTVIKYNLIGIIKRCDINGKEHYISLIRNILDKNWYLYDNDQCKKINNFQDHNEGIEIMLFYENSN